MSPEKVKEFYFHIKHGDEKHQEWLKSEFEKFFNIVIETSCPFCGPDGACGREWCPYTKEQK